MWGGNSKLTFACTRSKWQPCSEISFLPSCCIYSHQSAFKMHFITFPSTLRSAAVNLKGFVFIRHYCSASPTAAVQFFFVYKRTQIIISRSRALSCRHAERAIKRSIKMPHLRSNIAPFKLARICHRNVSLPLSVCSAVSIWCLEGDLPPRKIWDQVTRGINL